MVDARLLLGVEVLVAVIETGSFVRAAVALGCQTRGSAGLSRGWACGCSSERHGRCDSPTKAAGSTRKPRPCSHSCRTRRLQSPVPAGRCVVGSGLRWIPSSRGWCCLMQYPDLSLELVTTEAPGDLVAHGFDV